MKWQTNVSVENLKIRSIILNKIRTYFQKKNITEIETPILCSSSIIDKNIKIIKTSKKKLFLQSSPEFSMKILLSKKIKSIYQMCHVFRENEESIIHNTEFTMLEWYKKDFCYKKLMKETDFLIRKILQTNPAKKVQYKKIFKEKLQINPFEETLQNLKKIVNKITNKKYKNYISKLKKNDLLNILFEKKIQPHLHGKSAWIIYNYPKEIAENAKISKKNYLFAKRFEIFINGIELANGYEETTNAKKQLKILQKKKNENIKLNIPINIKLICSLNKGIQKCSGVSIGIDRLIMLKIKTQDIKNVITFPFNLI